MTILLENGISAPVITLLVDDSLQFISNVIYIWFSYVSDARIRTCHSVTSVSKHSWVPESKHYQLKIILENPINMIGCWKSFLHVCSVTTNFHGVQLEGFSDKQRFFFLLLFVLFLLQDTNVRLIKELKFEILELRKKLKVCHSKCY